MKIPGRLASVGVLMGIANTLFAMSPIPPVAHITIAFRPKAAIHVLAVLEGIAGPLGFVCSPSLPQDSHGAMDGKQAHVPFVVRCEMLSVDPGTQPIAAGTVEALLVAPGEIVITVYYELLPLEISKSKPTVDRLIAAMENRLKQDSNVTKIVHATYTPRYMTRRVK